MKLEISLNVVIVAMTLMLASCKTSQTTVQKTDAKGIASTTSTANVELLNRVTSNAQMAQYVTAKVKFKAQMDDKSIPQLGGKLYMKRDDVIRLQLTALGLFEAARIEFTQDYVLVMDRINKQYIKVPYSQVDFLNKSGLNFNSLQSLFWNELFLPGHTTRISSTDVDNYGISTPQTGTLSLKLDNGNLHYKWTADQKSGQINCFNGSYSDNQNTNVGVEWAYSVFKALGSKQFPTVNTIKVTTPNKTIDVDLQLSSIDNDSDWETRTQVSSKYKQVKIEDIMKKLSSL